MDRRVRALAGLALAATLLAGCNDGTPRHASGAGTPSAAPQSPSTSASEPTPVTPTPTDQPSEPDHGEASWKPVAGSTDDAVTISGKWTLTLPQGGDHVTLDGPRPRTFTPPDGFAFTDALIDGQFVIVSAEDEASHQPNVATILDLHSGETTTLDGSSEIPTTVGGAWALGSGLLVHATTQGHDYCLATVDLLSSRQTAGPCVPPRHGISNVVITPAGTSALTFDAGHPSCRTVDLVEDGEFRPIPGPTRCKAWDALSTESGSVWSVVPDSRRIEEAHFYADFGSGQQDLGPGTSGTLTWCGAAAYFVRDPQTSSDPAELIRVDDQGATVAFSSEGKGKAFLTEPRCGGRDLTVTALAAAGDQQVTARVG